MGFNLNPSKAITRALGLPDKVAPILDVAFLPLGATHLAGYAIGRGIQALNPPRQNANQLDSGQHGPPLQFYNQYSPPQYPQYQAPTYQQPIYPSYGGYDPWASSMTYSAGPAIPQATYYPPASPSSGLVTTVEDLLPLALAFL